MFSGKKRVVEVDSTIGKNTKIFGNLVFSGGLHIDGVVVGNVIAESEGSHLTISERGRIEGDVSVHYIQLNGEVIGDVHALKQIELAVNARVKGNVYYSIIQMAKGAEVNGSLIHGIGAGQPMAPASEEPARDEPEFRSEHNPVFTAPPQQAHRNAVNPNYAQPAHHHHFASAAPVSPGGFAANTAERQHPQNLPAGNDSFSVTHALSHIKMANHGGK